MAAEIERRFLVTAESAEALELDKREGSSIRQGYISSSTDANTCRVRIANDKATLTIKSKPDGPTRSEFELPIDLDQALEMLQTLTIGSPIKKTRYRIPHCGLTWEVDVFDDLNTGLIIAEVELKSEQQRVVPPSWVDREITTTPRYFNANLAQHPFTEWSENEKLATRAKTPSP